MVAEVHATGGEALRLLARELKITGEVGLRRELTKGLTRASKPLKKAAKANAAQILPHHGGLAAIVSGARLSSRTRTGATAGVRITAKSGKKKIDVEKIDGGAVRHPTYGRAPWVEQSVKPGWFTKPMEAGGAEVRTELLKVIDDIIRKLHG